MQKSLGQIESEFTKSMIQFEKEYLGRGPRDARTYIINDMIFIRLQGILTPAEAKLAESKDGRVLVKETRRQLFESSLPILEKMVREITNSDLVSMHTDMSSVSGERIVVLVTNTDLEKRYKGDK